MDIKNVVDFFRNAVKAAYKEQDTSRPYKKQKRMQIRVTELEGNQAEVELFYDQRFYRMFGQHLTVLEKVFEGDLKEACEVAKALKAELPSFEINYFSLEYMNSFETEMM